MKYIYGHKRGFDIKYGKRAARQNPKPELIDQTEWNETLAHATKANTVAVQAERDAIQTRKAMLRYHQMRDAIERKRLKRQSGSHP